MASRIVNFLYRNPAKGTKLKELFLQNIGLHEVFLESVPTALIITVIGVECRLFGKKYNFHFTMSRRIYLIIL